MKRSDYITINRKTFSFNDIRHYDSKNMMVHLKPNKYIKLNIFQNYKMKKFFARGLMINKPKFVDYRYNK